MIEFMIGLFVGLLGTIGAMFILKFNDKEED